MSKINAVRLINLNYNNNAIRISDEVFQMHGESTLMSLRNGGGKSVLVQMISAPFLHPGRRNTKDRLFEDYFTTSKPTFILVEWALDHGAGFVMTGMMVRRRQEISEERQDNLEIIQFISEYQNACPQDIYHLPVVEKNRREMVLKSFAACRQLFEAYRKDRSVAFFTYDMSNSAQSRQYFDKLAEYQIYYKEWETIIRKINQKESGLSELFAECRDEKGLVEKWMLYTVENKLNKDKNRMKEFQTILEKYVGQYKDNQSKIQRRDTIALFWQEADAILETSGQYQKVETKQQEQEQEIGEFIWCLQKAEAETGQLQQEIGEKKEQAASEKAHLLYQKLSKEVYKALEAERFQQAEREMVQLERDNAQQAYEQTLEQLHLLELARQQQEIDAQSAECGRYEQQLQVLGQKEQDFKQEREQLGYTLRLYYEKQCQELLQQLQSEEKEYTASLEKNTREEEKLLSLQRQILTQGTAIGSTEAKIQEYDGREAAYNKRYAPGFVRNILGEYEPVALELARQDYEKDFEELKRSCHRLQKESEQTQWKHKESERNLEDIRGKRMQREAELKDASRICMQYEEELQERKKLLRYFGVEESLLFDKTKILNAADKKLAELENIRRNLEKEEDQLQRDCQRLIQGKLLELPEEIAQMLDEAGISYVYGMDWLRRNQYTKKENQGLIKKHPMLPYALLLTAKDLDKLAGLPEQVYTSFPIPILVREQLEEMSKNEKSEKTEKAAILRLASGMHFYVWFNHHLLDEARLKQMIQEKEGELAKKREQIAGRKAEYENYFEKRERLRLQSVTRELQEKALQNKANLEGEIKELEEEVLHKKEEAARLLELYRDLERQIQDNQRKQDIELRRLEDLKELETAYTVYLEQREQLVQLKKTQQKLAEQEALTKEILQRLRERMKKLELSREELKRREGEARCSLAVYERYGKTVEAQGDIHKLEQRYQAITSQLSLQQQEVERLLQNTKEKQQRLEQQQERIRKKYQLPKDSWQQIHYEEQLEEYQEQLLKEREQKLEQKRLQWNEADKNAALSTQRLEQQRQILLETCGEAEPLPREEILPIDFSAELEKCDYHIRQLEKEQNIQLKRQGWYEETLTALAEYEDFLPVFQEEMIPEELTGRKEALKELSSEELRHQKGFLVRDYRNCLEQKQKQKERLVGQLNRMIRKEEFAEDFYRKPIESMLALTDDAGQVIKQLNTTLQSYDALMEKIQVDISMVEEEKQRIVELLEEYVLEVHRNLGMIDHNSTITVRGKALKMLKLILPEWEDNVNLYRIRIQDFMDELTSQAIALLEQNANIQEYFGTKVTTKHLYDVVVGISNVQIRLFKIEEQREYPITWSQVSRNSGGEGFLSAFIILSSLLYYMRKDETDLFAERNEGKVLVMDNPFAQTNAEHLLKPMMDMAKKTNTQLICLSGLGGESIYNRFDNIYVLNLIAANLRNGTQYVKAEHLRGMEEERMLVSQIEVLGQEELVF